MKGEGEGEGELGTESNSSNKCQLLITQRCWCRSLGASRRVYHRLRARAVRVALVSISSLLRLSEGTPARRPSPAPSASYLLNKLAFALEWERAHDRPIIILIADHQIAGARFTHSPASWPFHHHGHKTTTRRRFPLASIDQSNTRACVRACLRVGLPSNAKLSQFVCEPGAR